ncbi:hypothetical protein GCM10009836_50110 [Pseudonocardia ailaonensis]|uniref:Uncharacterized protein n=1 Tax=Pseudonocardia ailaonensis TaxID=367279 RepID=A0ABN2NGX3_9PSEU
MPSDALREQAPGERSGAVRVALRAFDLERFWPSRRSHAYDEGCR